jgi:hypothetical protein
VDANPTGEVEDCQVKGHIPSSLPSSMAYLMRKDNPGVPCLTRGA